jgi:hypothetical protein
LMNLKDGTTLLDGEHDLVVYKVYRSLLCFIVYRKRCIYFTFAQTNKMIEKRLVWPSLRYYNTLQYVLHVQYRT